MIDTECGTGLRPGKFYVLSPSFRGEGRFAGIEVVNEDKLLRPPCLTMDPPSGDPDQYIEKPHLIHLPEEGGLPRDFEKRAGIWIISKALKRVFEAVDPDGFAFTACDFTLADGSPGPQHYLADVIRSLDAIDEGASRMKIRYERDYQTGEDVKLYSLAGGASMIFLQDAVGDAHVFQQPRLPVDAICDHVMAEALLAADLDGVRLRDVEAF